MKFTNFSHKTPHLKGKQHQLDPNLDLKQLVHHATVKYVDRDADGDVDVYDNPKKNTPDENPKNINFGSLSKKLIDKQKGEIKHTKRGMAYENVNKNLEGVDMQAEEKRYCPICDKREGRSECSYGEKVWDKVSVKDEEYSMVRSELKTMSDAIKRLQMKVGKGEGNLEAWVQSKITKAEDYIDTAADYVVGGEIEEACWVGYRQVGMKKKGKKMVPNCVPEQKIVDKILDELSDWGNKTNEDVTIEDLEGNTFAEVVDLIIPEPIKGFKSQVSEATRLQAQTGNVIAITLSWRGKYYSIKIFFPQAKLPTRKEINDELQKVYPGCNVIYHTISEIQPGQPLIQAFGPQGGSSAKFGSNKNYVKTMGEEIEIDEDWQKVNRKDRTDGLSQKAVNAYRHENPGSKLQTAVTEKNPKGNRAQRRKDFCNRMSGMKDKLTSAETARDPDSNINKALRRWNCN